MKVAVIGGGASGLVCAVALKKSDIRNEVNVTVFEGRDRVGKKILATGNGRCNLMNSNFSTSFYSHPDFVLPATDKYNVDSNLAFFADMGLYTRQDSEGRIYPLSNQATSVLDILRYECNCYKVDIVCDTPVISIDNKNGFYYINGKKQEFDAIVLACGGPAGVKGYTSYDLLRSLGHKVEPPVPSLTKLCVKEKTFCKKLKGIRCKVNLTLKKNGKFISEESGEVLFTDYGLSGIAIMQLSAHVARDRKAKVSDFAVKADFIPEMDFDDISHALKRLIMCRQGVKNEELLCGFLPKRLGEEIIKSVGIPTDMYSQKLTGSQISSIASTCKGFIFNATELMGLSEAQVTVGGAVLSEFDSHTMESKKHRGLYCCGEMLDIDGLCGGYNLMWAISGARLCAESIIRKVNSNDKNK